ncbi:hypothetical protein TPA2_gp53 [Tsukamurella phage TPA2]|uniref:hypothetical protein n=1 Tax=Tsukamurella phage TPA2 TaxID=981330 RepID=UPI0001FF8DCC|nr:hypothetical protein TPA2_gp53 [Tsukamurella phage TPA2]ADX31967.1 hypothetical protein [Tsukamurella phage TPA2]
MSLLSGGNDPPREGAMTAMNPFSIATEINADRAATVRQVEFIASLLDEREWSNGSEKYVNRAAQLGVAIRLAMRPEWKRELAGKNVTAHHLGERVNEILAYADAAALTRSGASKLIELLKAQPRKAAKPVAEAMLDEVMGTTGEIADGFYEFTYDRGQVAIAKVVRAVHGSGHQYAKQLNPETGQFEYVGGLLAEVRQSGVPLTLERAKELGHLYGRCIRCGRTLTDEGSIAAGIGPVCAGKF